MIEVVAIILACMATGSSTYAFYLLSRIKNSELQIVNLKIENDRLKSIVLPKQPPTLIKQVAKR